MIPEKTLESKQFFNFFEEQEYETMKAMEQHNQELGPEDEDEEDDDDEEFDYEDNRSFLIPGEEEEIIRRDDDDDNETGLSREYF